MDGQWDRMILEQACALGMHPKRYAAQWWKRSGILDDDDQFGGIVHCGASGFYAVGRVIDEGSQVKNMCRAVVRRTVQKIKKERSQRDGR